MALLGAEESEHAREGGREVGAKVRREVDVGGVSRLPLVFGDHT